MRHSNTLTYNYYCKKVNVFRRCFKAILRVTFRFKACHTPRNKNKPTDFLPDWLIDSLIAFRVTWNCIYLLISMDFVQEYNNISLEWNGKCISNADLRCGHCYYSVFECILFVLPCDNVIVIVKKFQGKILLVNYVALCKMILLNFVILLLFFLN